MSILKRLLSIMGNGGGSTNPTTAMLDESGFAFCDENNEYIINE